MQGKIKSKIMIKVHIAGALQVYLLAYGPRTLTR
jgi:hypothetical protein